MAQINVNYADDLAAALDRVAAARRVARPELLRMIACEAVEAHDSGGLAFRREDGPRLDASISALVVQLREALIECARMQKENIRFQKRLQEAFTGSEETVRAALDKVSGQIRELNRESYQPFVDQLAELIEHLEAAEERAQAAVDVELQAIHERLGEVLKAAGQAKIQHYFVLGDDRTLSAKFLLSMAGIVGVLFILLFLLFVGQVQSLAVPVAHRMLADTEHVCQLLNHRFGVIDCEVPDEDRKRALMVIEASTRDTKKGAKK